MLFLNPRPVKVNFSLFVNVIVLKLFAFRCIVYMMHICYLWICYWHIFCLVHVDDVECCVPGTCSWSLRWLGSMSETGAPVQRQQLQRVQHHGGGTSWIWELSSGRDISSRREEEEADEDHLRHDDHAHRVRVFVLSIPIDWCLS